MTTVDSCKLGPLGCVQTPLAIWKRIREGKAGDIKAVLGSWVKAQWEQGIWNPPKQDQALQQVRHCVAVLPVAPEPGAACSAQIPVDDLLGSESPLPSAQDWSQGRASNTFTIATATTLC
jgi:hypothetical protein